MAEVDEIEQEPQEGLSEQSREDIRSGTRSAVGSLYGGKKEPSTESKQPATNSERAKNDTSTRPPSGSDVKPPPGQSGFSKSLGTASKAYGYAQTAQNIKDNPKEAAKEAAKEAGKEIAKKEIKKQIVKRGLDQAAKQATQKIMASLAAAGWEVWVVIIVIFLILGIFMFIIGFVVGFTSGGGSARSGIAGVATSIPNGIAAPYIPVEGKYFPLAIKPQNNFTPGSSRGFGDARSGGKRHHAGVDLIAPPGTQIKAIADGTIVNFYSFYSGTYALFVDHGDFVINYGENAGMAPGLGIGSTVKAGQVIASVGRLGSGASMLHMEMYAPGTTQNAQWWGSNRPPNLINPTDFVTQLLEGF